MPKFQLKYMPFYAVCGLLCGGIVMFKALPVHADDVQIIQPASPEDSTTRDQRNTDRKVKFQAQLDQKSLAVFATKCDLVKKTVTGLQDKDSRAMVSRHDFYVTNADKLYYIVQNLKTLNIATSSLEAARQQYVNATNSYIADAGIYKATLDDLVKIDCAKDTMAYKAGVLDAREKRSKLAADVQAIKATYPQIQAAISSAKTSLSATKAGN